jgi:hypothetical protein
MEEQARISSIDALGTLRASFIVYQKKCRRAVDMSLDEVNRLRQWLLCDSRMHWEGQIKKWNQILSQARSELMTVRLSALVDRSTRHEEEVRKAERALAHAQEKLKATKRWARDFDIAAGPHVRRLESVRDHYVHQLPKAVAWLHQAELTLEAYSERRAFSSPATPAAAETETSNPAPNP